METLEAKPFDQNAENWKRENRLFTSTVLEAGVTAYSPYACYVMVWVIPIAQ